MKISPLSLLPFFLLPVFSFGQKNITGDWYGTLNIQNMVKLRLVFHISGSEGQLTATLDSPDQGSFGIPTGEVIFTPPQLTIKMPILMAEYAATVNEDFTQLEGTFTQRGMEMPLTMGRQTVEKEVLNRPQEPKPPFPYHEEEVTFKNTAAGIHLSGTLTLPKNKDKFPVVVLVSGSGPQDRNEELLDHKPFLVLADHLTRQGIGVLRYDDRGVGGSQGNFAGATSEDFASDALAAVQYLKKRRDLKKHKIGIIGHSEGGMIAPMVAARSKDVRFIVLLAGPGVRGADLLLKQIELISRAAGGSKESIEKTKENNRAVFDLILSVKDTAQLRQKVTDLVKKQYESLSEEERKEAGSLETTLQQTNQQLLSPWMLYFLRYDPAPNLTKVKCPVLALNGEKDLQVEPKSNLSGIRSALEKAKNKHFTVKELPGLNHLFQTCKTGSPAEYRSIEETFSPMALAEVSDWILKTVK